MESDEASREIDNAHAIDIEGNEKENNSLTILETGTARGFSAICMSKALIDQKKSGFV